MWCELTSGALRGLKMCMHTWNPRVFNSAPLRIPPLSPTPIQLNANQALQPIMCISLHLRPQSAIPPRVPVIHHQPTNHTPKTMLNQASFLIKPRSQPHEKSPSFLIHRMEDVRFRPTGDWSLAMRWKSLRVCLRWVGLGFCA